MKQRWFLFVGIFGCLIFFGAGCLAVPVEFLSHLSFSSSSPAAERVAREIQFSSGDTFYIHQTAFGVGIDTAREVKIEKFIPHERAIVSWMMQVKQETDASRMARQKYFADLHSETTGTYPAPPPTIITEQASTVGSMDGIDLATAQTVYLPTYWMAGPTHLARGKSALWIASEVWNGLMTTQHAWIGLGSLDDTAKRFLFDVNYVKHLISQWRHISSTGSSVEDPGFFVLDHEPISQKISINGSDVTVSAWKAHNAYAEITILNNPENPLILKLTVNPIIAGGDILKGFSALENVLGFRLDGFTVAKFPKR